MENDSAFRSKVTDSLEVAAGEELRAVNYAVLSSDEPEFLVESPNGCGVCRVELCFDNYALELQWGWDNALRSKNIHYHIQTLIKSVSDPKEKKGTYNAAAGDSALWCNAINTKLQSIEVYGIEDTPQAIRFMFPLEALVVVVGNSGDELSIGDGDEMLILSDEEWNREVERDEHRKWNNSRQWDKLWKLPRHSKAH